MLERNLLPPNPPSSIDGLAPQPPVNFTTIVGEMSDLQTLPNHWQAAQDPLLFDLEPPRILPMPGEVAGVLLGDPSDLRVAVLRHPDGTTAEVARAVSRYTTRLRARSRLIVDPGYWLAPVSAALPVSGSGVWLTDWAERRPEILTAYRVPTIPTSFVGAAALTRSETARVLVIDTGDERAVAQDAFLMSATMGTVDSPPQDWHGHGTSLSDVIRLRAPDAQLTSARVFEQGNPYCPSPSLLNALIFAVSGAANADIVCIAQRALILTDESRNLETLQFILARARDRGHQLPIFVCAAGNTWGGDTMALPATLPGVLVARAQDWAGGLADYNCKIPLTGGVITVDAYGGTQDEPLGTMICSDGRTSIRMYGSSYAAALVTGALAQL